VINLQSPHILPHTKAPMYDGADWRLTLQHAMSEMTSENLSTGSEEVRQVLRQTGLVDMHFFLKHIAGYSGPYKDITEHLHREMCNYYMYQMSIEGSRASGFVPRSYYKSTVWTHGGNTFELNRNPNLRIALTSGVADRAQMFMKTTQRTFDDNELMEWLYPENYVKSPKSQSGWSDKMTVMPSRTINHPEPSIQLVTAGGSSQGVHAELLKIDDIVGDSELDSEHMAGAEMLRRANWLKSNTRTLLLNWKTSRIFVVGTRYAVDDPYEFIMESLKWCTPALEELPYDITPEGSWDCYYRLIKENGLITFPENFNEEGLVELYNDDPWTYWSQYFNNPHKAQSSDMNMYEFKKCWLDYEGGEPIITLPSFGEKIYVADCDVVQCVDPAASERRKDAKTSRSAHVVLATDHQNRKFFIGGAADYVEIMDVWKWIAKGVRVFGKYLRMTGVEQQGPFKLLGPLFRAQAREDGIDPHMRAVQTSGDKDARIRSFLQPPLSKGEVYAVEGIREILQQELDTFPGSKRKDVLDAASMALQVNNRPGEPKRRSALKRFFKNQNTPTSSTTGY